MSPLHDHPGAAATLFPVPSSLLPEFSRHWRDFGKARLAENQAADDFTSLPC